MKAAVLLLLTFPVAAVAFDPRYMKIGQSGEITNFGIDLTIKEVGDDWLYIRCDSKSDPTFYFLVRGVATKGLADDKPWDYKGSWKVTDTEKYKGKTVYVLRPFDPKR